ncbi:GMP/IMP nucleotidase [Escherichia coli]|nr:GMP/IMP nucleotidase [Escherichia coli]
MWGVGWVGGGAGGWGGGGVGVGVRRGGGEGWLGGSGVVRVGGGTLGVRDGLGVTNPDSGMAEKQYQRHPSLNDCRRLIPSLM